MPTEAPGAHTQAKVLDQAVDVLRAAGAQFAFLHGSQASGTSTPVSDADVAVHFGGQPVDLPYLFGSMPVGVDLLVLDNAPLELAGRVATYGVLLWETDPAARVRWQADTRKIWFDEKPRIAQARRDFVAGQRQRTRHG